MGGVENYILASLTFTLVRGEWSASRPGRSSPGECPLNGRLVGPRIGLGDENRRKILLLPGLELWSHSHPVCSQSLYQLYYLGSHKHACTHIKWLSFTYVWVYMSMQSCWYLNPGILLFTNSELENNDIKFWRSTHYIRGIGHLNDGYWLSISLEMRTELCFSEVIELCHWYKKSLCYRK